MSLYAHATYGIRLILVIGLIEKVLVETLDSGILSGLVQSKMVVLTHGHRVGLVAHHLGEEH